MSLVENITADGDYPSTGYFETPGRRSLAFWGAFGAATVEFIFFTEDDSGTKQELPASTDFTFSGTLPAPEAYYFPENMPYKIRVTGSDGSTNFSVNAHEVDT